MTENDMNLHAIIDRLLDRLERENRCGTAPVVFDASSGRVDKNHPDLVAARAEVIELQQRTIEERDEQIIGLKAEIHTMAGIISNLRVWQIAAKNLLTRRKVAKRLWPKEPKPEARA